MTGWSIANYNTNPDENTSINGVNIAEFCNASGINDAIRQLMADLAVFAGVSTTPSGAIQAFAGTTAPSGWLLCDGSAVSRTTYAALFSAVNTTWGAGDGSTTFNLPDFRGRVIVGAGGGFNLAANGGEASHTLSTSELPSLSGSVSGTTGAGSPHTHGVSDPGHSHTYESGYTGAGFAADVSGGSPGPGTKLSTDSATTGVSIGSEGSHTHSFSATVAITNGGGAHNNMQPYAVANVIIKI